MHLLCISSLDLISSIDLHTSWNKRTPITLRHDRDQCKIHEANNKKKKSSFVPCQVTSVSKEAFHKQYCS